MYTVVETRGAAHNQEFEVECAIPKLEVSVRGNGRSRRGAEQSAAKLALEAAQAAAQALRRAKRKGGAAPETDAGGTPVQTGAGAAGKPVAAAESGANAKPAPPG